MGFGNVNDLLQIACKHIQSMRQSYKIDFVEIRLILVSCCASLQFGLLYILAYKSGNFGRFSRLFFQYAGQK